MEGGCWGGDEGGEDYGEGCYVGVAVLGGHGGEVCLDRDGVAVAGEGAEEDVVGMGVGVEVVGGGPGEDGVEEVVFFDVDEGVESGFHGGEIWSESPF